MKCNIGQKLLVSGVSLLLTGLTIAAPSFTPDSQPTGWVSRPVVTFFDVSTGSESFYQLDYRKDTWAGNVLAFDIGNTARIQTSGPWDNTDPTTTTAASKLETADYSSGRKIVTWGSPFRWANMSASEKAALGSEAILNFIRGDRSNEEPNGLSFYKRESVLGNILHSNLYYLDDGTNQTVYVGANDGMLHSFDANTGVENFAYVPSMLIPRLDRLVAKNFVHTHYVDGPISIAKMDISGTLKTILVGGLGAGGTGLYAIDISTAKPSTESAAASQIMWEITASGSFNDLGYTYGTPQLTKLNNGSAAVIIGNGYVNSGSGRAVLYIINATTGALISAIDTGSGSTASPNGLSSPALYDSNGDGRPEYAYAGDIDGNLWKFDLVNYTSSLLFTTSPVQAITTAPVIQAHPLGGQMVDFATGRILTSGDELDSSVHYAYGIWDGAPAGNSRLLTQTLSSSMSNGGSVRTVSNNAIDWSSGNHKGWKVALPPGERIVGEKPFYNSGRFYFLATNPTIEAGENWLHELVFHTGGEPGGSIFDLNGDGSFDDLDLADNGNIPVAKYLGIGVFSQPRLVRASGLVTTLYAFHPDLPVENGVPVDPADPGVSGGHFDFDIYYYDPPPAQPTSDEQVRSNICSEKKKVEKQLDEISPGYCTAANGFDSGYVFMTDFVENSKCGGKKKYFDITCATYTTNGVAGDYANVKHEHEYDDKYDVTGVNMLNASLPAFNLINAITDTTTAFKVLVMNQYLNPAAKVSVGGVDYESVKTFGNLASETDPTTLLNGLTSYTRNNVGTLIYNLPLDAFKSKDWWGDGGVIRAGLIPTQTGCVNKVNKNGSMQNDTNKKKGILGPNGERFNGALTLQLIRPTTPASALEFNGPDVRYGWRVKQSEFTKWVITEYTSFWHHPNKFCYGEANWVPDAPQDFESSDKSETAAPGSSDPKDGVFGEGLSFTDVTTTQGNTTTLVRTYSDNSTYTRTDTVNDDGSTTIVQDFRDGTTLTTTIYSGDGGHAGFIDPNTGSPEEEIGTGLTGRQSWRDNIDE